MIHIGGYYQYADGTNHVGGTYGCFGIVHPGQISPTQAGAEIMAQEALLTLKDEDHVPPMTASNSEQNRLVTSVQKATANAKKRKEADASKIKVNIKKRSGVKTVQNRQI